MGRLNGKVRIVTGAARGIGRAIAAFHAEGAIVILTDIDEAAGVTDREATMQTLMADTPLRYAAGGRGGRIDARV